MCGFWWLVDGVGVVVDGASVVLWLVLLQVRHLIFLDSFGGGGLWWLMGLLVL